MPFEPRTFTQIVADAIEFVRVNSNLTDFNRGSVIRTILEAAGMEDDEQYYQMVQLLKEFSYKTASTAGLIRRAADFDISPQSAAPSSGNVIIMDDGLERTYLSPATTSGGTSVLTVEDAGVFTALTPPFSALLAEGTAEEEIVTVSAFSVPLNTVTLSAPTVNSHTGLGSASFDDIRDEFFLDGARISYISGGGDKSINAGQIVAAPAVGELSEVRFLTAQISTIVNGDFKSESTAIRASKAGIAGNVGTLRIINFPVTKPFADAVVINPTSVGGGVNDETVAEFAERITQELAALPGATVIAIRTALINVQVPDTAQRIARTSLLEEFVRDPLLPGDGLVKAYVDDGSGAFSPDINQFGQGNLDGAFLAGVSTLDASITEGTFAARGWIIIDPSPSGTPEIVEYTSIDSSPTVFNLANVTELDHADDDIILQVEQIIAESDVNRKIYLVENIAIVPNTFRLFKLESLGSPTLTELTLFNPDTMVVADADYFLNEGKGHIEIFPTSVPIQGSGIYAYYNSYSGLIERGQRTLNGDVRNISEFPGVAAGGVKVLVLPASAVSIDISLELIILEGYSRAELVERTDRIIRNYINGLEPGADFIVNEMIERVMTTTGMFDLRVNTPAANVIVDYSSVAIPGTLTIT